MAALQGRMRLAVGLLFFISFYGMMGWAGELPEAGRGNCLKLGGKPTRTGVFAAYLALRLRLGLWWLLASFSPSLSLAFPLLSLAFHIFHPDDKT